MPIPQEHVPGTKPGATAREAAAGTVPQLHRALATGGGGRAGLSPTGPRTHPGGPHPHPPWLGRGCPLTSPGPPQRPARGPALPGGGGGGLSRGGRRRGPRPCWSGDSGHMRPPRRHVPGGRGGLGTQTPPSPGTPGTRGRAPSSGRGGVMEDRGERRGEGSGLRKAGARCLYMGRRRGMTRWRRLRSP